MAGGYNTQDILIGHEGNNFVRLSVLATANDPDWLVGEVEAKAGCWRGACRAWFFQGELRRLAADLKQLYGTLTGRVDYRSIEANVEVAFVGDGLGHIQVRGRVREDPASETAIHFEIGLDQTELPELIARLESADGPEG